MRKKQKKEIIVLGHYVIIKYKRYFKRLNNQNKINKI